MLISFHLRATYGLLQPALAAGSNRLRAGASADAAFAPASRGRQASKARAGPIQREEQRRCLALIPISSALKLILGTSHIYSHGAHCRSLQVDGRQMAVPDRRSGGASKFVIKVLRWA
jgi:hypothetical protein